MFEQTMNVASGFSVHLLLQLCDVDHPEDIPPKISIIIPTLNEVRHLGGTLERATSKPS